MLNKVIEIESIAPFKLRVRFSNGATGTHDCARLVQTEGPIFEPLRDPKYFSRVFLEFGAPTWPNGFDMCPDWLHMTMADSGELRSDAAE